MRCVEIEFLFKHTKTNAENGVFVLLYEYRVNNVFLLYIVYFFIPLNAVRVPVWILHEKKNHTCGPSYCVGL